MDKPGIRVSTCSSSAPGRLSLLTDAIRPGVVSLPHGFGHVREGARLSVASQRQPGVNANQLTDELPLDVPSGTHIANGIPVEIEAA